MKLFNTDIDVLKVDKSKFKKYESDILKSNDTVLKYTSLAGAVTFLIVAIINLTTRLMDNNSVAYLVFFVLCSLIFISCEIPAIKNAFVRKARVILFLYTMLGFGIVMGTLAMPKQLTVSYMIFMIAVPMLFIMRPLYMNILILISMLIYVPLAYMTQSGDVFVSNMFNVTVYGLLSMVITSYMMLIKMQRFMYKSRNDKLVIAGKQTEKRIEKYDNFISDMIRYSAKDGDAEDIINQILEYIGKAFEADRAYIFEANAEGTFDNTFEWTKEGVPAEINNLQGLPYEGMIEIWIEQYRNSNNILIRDVEEYKTVCEPMYNLLKSENVSTLVTGPIKVNGVIVGFYGVDNPPAEIVDMVSDLINLAEYVISMMIRLRDDAKELERSALHDQLTGCKNRMALSWVYSSKHDKEMSVAAIMCDLNGLKEINDKQGHDAGDKFILRTVEVLNEVFGHDAVYRMGGDEFLIVLTHKSRAEVDDRLNLCKLQLGNTACIGVAYREHFEDYFDEILKEADKELYQQKNLYYQTHKKYR